MLDDLCLMMCCLGAGMADRCPTLHLSWTIASVLVLASFNEQCIDKCVASLSVHHPYSQALQKLR